MILKLIYSGLCKSTTCIIAVPRKLVREDVPLQRNEAYATVVRVPMQRNEAYESVTRPATHTCPDYELVQ